jgi:hypothetical protein
MADFETEFPELANAKVLFGLRAQGHIPTIERMLAVGEGWGAIGRAIGWEPAAAEQHYAEHLDAEKRSKCPYCGSPMKSLERDADWGTRFLWINYECGSFAEYMRREHKWHWDDGTRRC